MASRGWGVTLGESTEQRNVPPSALLTSLLPHTSSAPWFGGLAWLSLSLRATPIAGGLWLIVNRASTGALDPAPIACVHLKGCPCPSLPGLQHLSPCSLCLQALATTGTQAASLVCVTDTPPSVSLSLAPGVCGHLTGGPESYVHVRT